MIESVGCHDRRQSNALLETVTVTAITARRRFVATQTRQVGSSDRERGTNRSGVYFRPRSSLSCFSRAAAENQISGRIAPHAKLELVQVNNTAGPTATIENPPNRLMEKAAQ